MVGSVRNAIEQPKYTLSSILQGLHSLRGSRILWVVVEDVEDKVFYERFSNLDTSCIKTSEDENGYKGCEKVESIVREIRSKGYTNVIGIRDADYLRYGHYEIPPGIFVTDQRDLEMTLLYSQSVKDIMSREIPDFVSGIERSMQICRLAGYARIMNSVHDLGCNFKKKVKISKVWDENNHTPLDDWKEKYIDNFIVHCKPECTITKAQFYAFVESLSLDNEPNYYVCQGHDVMRVFHYLKKNAPACNPYILVKKMINAYPFDEFKHMSLYQNTFDYSESIGIELWNT